MNGAETRMEPLQKPVGNKLWTSRRWDDFHIRCGKPEARISEFLPAQATWQRAHFWWQVIAEFSG
jgi:hypothetical protein